MDKHLLVPLLVECSTLKNKLWCINPCRSTPSHLNDPSRKSWLSVMMKTSTWKTVMYLGIIQKMPGSIISDILLEKIQIITATLMNSPLILMQSLDRYCHQHSCYSVLADTVHLYWGWCANYQSNFIFLWEHVYCLTTEWTISCTSLILS